MLTPSSDWAREYPPTSMPRLQVAFCYKAIPQHHLLIAGKEIKKLGNVIREPPSLTLYIHPDNMGKTSKIKLLLSFNFNYSYILIGGAEALLD